MRKPDLNAPRFRYKFKNILGKDLIKRFKEKYPKYADYKDDDLIQAIVVHNKLIAKEVIDNRDGVELPSGMGSLFIGTVRSSGKNIAWKKSVDLGLKVYHRNWETDSRVGKIFFTSFGTKYKFEGSHLWYLNGARTFTRAVAAVYPKQWNKYITIDSNKGILKLYNKNTYRNTMRAKQAEDLKTYSEFDFE